MNTQTLIAMFLWSELEHHAGKLETSWGETVYQGCGMGAIEVANGLQEFIEEIQRKHCREQCDDITDILYIHIPNYAEKLAKFMYDHGFMPQSIYNLKE